ncbi:ankyrin repeat domain-containing protein 13C isoform X1 [Carettochelys insculpta]|uniref:ankyrin repeat domain-containing protein 13C isoform X1 n=1 Tax=Carettochelys insculpta TaxID=44489 RepID=UPI003EC0ED67
MTGEKLRSLRRDHKPSKEDGDLLGPGEEEAAVAPGGVFTGSRGGSGKGGRAGGHRIFSNHHRLQLKGAPGAPAAPPGLSPAAEPDKCPAHFPVHECVFKGDVRRLSALIRTQGIGQKDSHGNTPLHLAVMLGHKECAHLLLAHNAPVKVKNAQGWSPLAEAISYGDRQMITALLRKLKQQSRESVEEKRPRLLKALKELGDFYLELHWDFQSWVPLLSRILPSDACKIYKQGINIRLDTTLIDFTDMKCQRGDLSFIFNGDAAPSESFVVLDNEQKVYQRIHHEAVRAINAMLLHRLVRLGDPDATIAAFATLGFPNCFGALDGTHIPICAPHHSGGRYMNRKGYHSVVLQALVDSRGRFQDIYVGWPGSTHDARVFRNSGLCRRLEVGTYIPQREIPLGDTTMPFCVIADAAYPLRPWLMHPYAGHLSASQERFNECLNCARQVVERSFGRLKGRWRCLLTCLDAGPNNIPLIVGACCALHNLVESKGETFFQGWAAEAGRADVQPPAAPSRQVDPEGTQVQEALRAHFDEEAAG